MNIPPLKDQIAGSCKHFTGIQNDTCKIGVNYLELVGGERKGIGCKIPCTGDKGCSHAPDIKVVPCALREFLTPEEVQAEEDMINAHMAQALIEMVEGICIHCHVKIEHYDQIGRSVYARPCGHRQYQGKVPPDKPSTIVTPYPDWDEDE